MAENLIVYCKEWAMKIVYRHKNSFVVNRVCHHVFKNAIFNTSFPSVGRFNEESSSYTFLVPDL